MFSIQFFLPFLNESSTKEPASETRYKNPGAPVPDGEEDGLPIFTPQQIRDGVLRGSCQSCAAPPFCLMANGGV